LAALSYTDEKWLAAAIAIVVLVMALAMAGAAGPASATKGANTTPRMLRVLLGADGRLSTSRAVALAWTAVVTYILVALIIGNPKSWSDALKNLSPNYLLLLGFPYASLVLAKTVVAKRVASGTLAKPSSQEPGRLSQLFSDDNGDPDIFDVQYVIFNVVAMVFVNVAFSRAGLTSGFPEVPDGLLLLTGGPASIYVANKFMPGSAPAIFSVAPGEVRVGQTFTVIGQNLASSAATDAAPTVRVGGAEASSLVTHTPTSLVVTAPDVGADLGRAVDVTVTVASGAQATVSGALKVLGRVPTVDGADRGIAQVGDDVALRGDWTVEEASDLTVLVDTSVVGAVRRSAEAMLTFTVPPLADLASPRSVPVKVKLGAEQSGPITLIVSERAPATDAGNGAPMSAPTNSGVRIALGQPQ
jgi:hypothetical protein